MDKKFGVVAAAAGVFAGGTLVFAGLWAVTLQEREELAAENASLAQQVDTWEYTAARLETENERASADLKNREAAVKAREDAVTAVEQAPAVIPDLGVEEAWIVQVRECLARPGDFVSASVSNSSFAGLDFTCFSG